ncbi:Gfo/Idh/MocA family oxidoreductase [Schleiferiaceae bacterium]|nr:Gfo/Idh/MocA family oxidoreductase [Schleiferiaceae bacterium]
MEITKTRCVVVGWGRMGIIHTSIINGLYPDLFEYVLVEPNKNVSRITRKTLGYQIVSDIKLVSFKGALVLITTPPMIHSDLCDIVISGGASAVFVEKPFGLYDKRVEDDFRISVGYVLRFSEVAQRLKALIQEEGCIKISLDYSSHTLTKPPKGWRNSEYGGVLNEMGSHLIDLILYLGGGKEFKVLSSKIESVVSDVDDIVCVNGILGNIEVELSLNWVNPDYRKPVWSGFVQTSKQTVRFDQQSIDGGFEVDTVDYYVRGRDFSLQMKHFIENDKSIICNSTEANSVHDVINKIREKA